MQGIIAAIDHETIERAGRVGLRVELSGTIEGNGVGAGFAHEAADVFRQQVERLVPGDGHEDAPVVDAQERFCKPVAADDRLAEEGALRPGGERDSGTITGRFLAGDVEMIRAYLATLVDKGYSAASMARKIATLRSFYKWMLKRGLVTANPMALIRTPRQKKRLPKAIPVDQVERLLAAPDDSDLLGARDRAMLETLYSTGIRVSEVVGINGGDIDLAGETVLIRGKGRKERVVPLWKSTAAHLRAWMTRIGAAPDAPIFVSRTGRRISRSGVADRLRVTLAAAAKSCPSLAGRRISPHTLRHTTAMHLLQSGVDLTTIALWLGHEDPSTTHLYVEADLAMKEAALRRLEDPSPAPLRFRASDRLLAFLEAL